MTDLATITRYRGDTRPDKFTLTTAAGAVVDITGYTFRLTVNKRKNPTDITAQVFTVTGTITNATAGQYEFRPSAGQVNVPPGTYYYDVEVTDTGGYVTTLGVGSYIFVQDVSK